MYHKIRRFTVALMFCFGFFVPGTASAVATADAPNFGAQIWENIQDTVDWGKEKAMMMTEMDLKSMLSKLEIDAMTNGFANMIARSGAAMQNIQNLKLSEMMATDFDICGNVSYSLYGDEIGCVVDDQTNAEVHKQTVDQARFTMIGPDYKAFIQEKTSALVDECAVLTQKDIQDPDLSKAEALEYSECFQAGKIFGSGAAASTLTEVESEALNNAIELMVDPVPNRKQSQKLVPGSPSYNKAVVEESRQALPKIFATNSLHEVKKWYSGVKGSDGEIKPSKMAKLEAWVDDRGPGWVTQIGGGKINGSGSGNEDTTVYPSQIARKSLEVDRWRAALQLEQFKQQLRVEGLEALQLSLLSELSGG